MVLLNCFELHFTELVVGKINKRVSLLGTWILNRASLSAKKNNAFLCVCVCACVKTPRKKHRKKKSMSLEEMQQQWPFINWRTYFELIFAKSDGISVDDVGLVNVVTPSYFEELSMVNAQEIHRAHTHYAHNMRKRTHTARKK